MDFFEDKEESETPDKDLEKKTRADLAAERAQAKSENETKTIGAGGAGAYLAKMAAKTAKDKEESAAKKLLKSGKDKKGKTPSIKPAVGDTIAPMSQQMAGGKSGGGGGGAAMLGLFGKIAGTAIGGPAGGMIGGMAGNILGGAMAKDGGQIASKIKAKPKAKKRYVRGVGAAKRGYGKATYSKKMY